MFCTLDNVKLVKQTAALPLCSHQVSRNIILDQIERREIEKLYKTRYLKCVFRTVHSLKLYKITAY